MFFFDWPGEHDDFAVTSRRESEATLGCGESGERAKHPAEASDFNPQTSAVRFVDKSRAECSREKDVPGYISGPRLCQRPGEREQDGASGERNDGACIAHDITAGIHDKGLRRQQRFDISQQEEALLAGRD